MAEDALDLMRPTNDHQRADSSKSKRDRRSDRSRSKSRNDVKRKSGRRRSPSRSRSFSRSASVSSRSSDASLRHNRRHRNRSTSRSQSRSRPYRRRSRSPRSSRDFGSRGRRSFGFRGGFRSGGGKWRPSGYRRGYSSYYNRNRRSFTRSRSRSRSVTPESRSRSASPVHRSRSSSKSKHSSPAPDLPLPPIAATKSAKLLNPADIKRSQKQITENFLASLGNSHNRLKMVPIGSNENGNQTPVEGPKLPDEQDDQETFATRTGEQSRSGFLNTFASLDHTGHKVKETKETDTIRKDRKAEMDDLTHSEKLIKRKTTEECKSGKVTGNDSSKRKDHQSEPAIADKKSSKVKPDDKHEKSKGKRKRARSESSDDSSEQSEVSSDEEERPQAKDSKRKSKLKKQKRTKSRRDASSEADDDEMTELKAIDKEKSRKSHKKSKKRKKDEKSTIESKPKKHAADKKTVHSSDSESDAEDKTIKKSSKRKKDSKRKHSKKTRPRESSAESSSDQSSDSDEDEDSDEMDKKKKSHKKKAKKNHKKKTSKSSKSRKHVSKDSDDDEDAGHAEHANETGSNDSDSDWSTSSNSNVSSEMKKSSKSKKKSIKSKKSKKELKVKSEKKSRKETKKEQKVIRDATNDGKVSIQKEEKPKSSKKVEDIPKKSITDSALVTKFDVKENPDLKKAKSSPDTKMDFDNRIKAGVRHYTLTRPEIRYSFNAKALRMFESKKHQFCELYSRKEDHLTKNDVKAKKTKLEKEEDESEGMEVIDSFDRDDESENMTEERFETTVSTTVPVSDDTTKDDQLPVATARSRTPEKKKVMTAQQLLERVKQKKQQEKGFETLSTLSEEAIKSSSIEDQFKERLSGEMKGIMEKLAKKQLNKMTIPQAPFVPPGYGQNLHQDYMWYLHYYMNSFGLDGYSAAYYAQYAIVTCGHYQSSDVNQWMQEQGYQNKQDLIAAEPDVNAKVSTDANEMNTKQDVNVNTHSEEIEVNSSEETNLKGLVDQKTDLAESDPNKKTNENGDDIHILADVPYTTNEMFSDHQQTGDTVSTNTESSSPPPPPPELPQMTSFTSVNEITLPNGVKLPSGTKQIFVHPYHPSHPLARNYTEDEFNKLTANPNDENNQPVNLGYNTATSL